MSKKGSNKSVSADQRYPNLSCLFFLTLAENSVEFGGIFLQGRGVRFKAHRWAAVQNRWGLGLAGLNRAIAAKGRPAVQPAGSPGFETPPAAEGYSTSS
jgi:hypothetical protein